MNFDTALISHLEKLAQLQLSPAERECLAADLTAIMAMVEQLQQVDTHGVEPLIWLSGEENVFRQDETAAPLPRPMALSNAPLHDGQFFYVPKFLTNTRAEDSSLE